jgi:hypothetical protein
MSGSGTPSVAKVDRIASTVRGPGTNAADVWGDGRAEGSSLESMGGDRVDEGGSKGGAGGSEGTAQDDRRRSTHPTAAQRGRWPRGLIPGRLESERMLGPSPTGERWKVVHDGPSQVTAPHQDANIGRVEATENAPARTSGSWHSLTAAAMTDDPQTLARSTSDRGIAFSSGPT